MEESERWELDANIAHPVLLPKNSCISVAIIRWFHEMSEELTKIE